ncbi:MAG: molybdopterin-binding protein [Xanthobacteraceae bacterium]|nr:molybdopterin-binding protein [Xanthobacteraceae bacterium]
MTSSAETVQRLTILTPVAEILSRLDTLVSPATVKNIAPDAGIGATYAADVIAPADFPQHATAMQDGWAVASEQIVDAGSYAPAILVSPPQWVEAGQRMPAGTDAILPVDAVTATDSNAEVHAPAAPGEGVVAAGNEAAKGTALRKAGARVRPVDAAILRALGIEAIPVRVPRVKIVVLSVRDARADFIAPVIANAVRANGGAPEIAYESALEAALSRLDNEAVITIGGTGSGRNDHAVKSLARIGKLEVHGFGISPGQTAALGSVDSCPVLMLPGRLDAALAVFLVAGRRLMNRLNGLNENETELPLPLTKKVASTIGLAEIVFVRRVSGGIEPLGVSSFPAQALLQADGWILIPAESEGVAAGSVVAMRNLP